jgi:hypothetical protein
LDGRYKLTNKSALTGKPDSIEKYIEWMSKNEGVKIDARVGRHYESVVNKCHSDIVDSAFWRQFSSKLTEFDQEYTVDTSYSLLLTPGPPVVVKKPYTSFLDKTFRKNVLNNENWPNAPNGGWLVPTGWFSRVGDLVRTTVVVKYLDGVEFLVRQLKQIAEQCNLRHKEYFESRDEGYYAAHFYAYFTLGIPTLSFDSKQLNISFEVQVTTQLQEVIRKLLHSYYQERRSTHSSENLSWQWRYRDEEFSVNYLGHILHYLEGQIVEIREKKK